MKSSAIVLGLALVGVGCDSSGGGSPPPGGPGTYYEDVTPLFAAKCVKCPVDDGIAPMDLRSFAAVTEYLAREPDKMRERVSSREMPPWPPNDDCASYVGDRSLAQAQIVTIVDWLDGGALEG